MPKTLFRVTALLAGLPLGWAISEVTKAKPDYRVAAFCALWSAALYLVACVWLDSTRRDWP
jgi:hypothetical protein